MPNVTSSCYRLQPSCVTNTIAGAAHLYWEILICSLLFVCFVTAVPRHGYPQGQYEITYATYSFIHKNNQIKSRLW